MVSTPLSFIDGNGFIAHKAEIFGIPAANQLGVSPKMAMSISRNGVTYRQERWASTGARGAHDATPRWRKLGYADKHMTLKFRVVNDSLFTPARLDVSIEALNA